ncbi:hypothetical protein ZWY2020_017808 [Hordeum vulgare]|nr:hypothetical protein ZWY2020_017808 [Hordeum vulgare]
MTMSTKRRHCVRTRTPPASASATETLSVDLLLEIVVRCDVKTIVRCAATSRTLRRAILNPAFRRQLALQAAACSELDPSLLVGVSYLKYYGNDSSDSEETAHGVVRTGEPTRRRALRDAVSIRPHQWFMPVAARDALFLRWCDSPQADLHVCNTLTGQVTELPLAAVPDAHHRVLLSVGDLGGSFEVLVADESMRLFQIFSSKHGKWGAVREASSSSVTSHNRDRTSTCCPRPAIIGRTVYWIIRESRWRHCLALDVDAAEATVMDLPPGFASRMMRCHCSDKHVLLAPVRGRLSLLVTESLGISMWTLLTYGSAKTWNRRLVIGASEMLRQAGFLHVRNDLTHAPFDLEGFGQRSGSLIMSACSRVLFRLDIFVGIKEAPVVKRIGSLESGRVKDVFLHEIDQMSYLQAMEFF